MTAPAFPLSQLGRPSVDYTLKPSDLRVRTDTYSGLAQSYNASNAGLTTISVKWEWGADNYAVFQDWFRNDCKDGSIEFTIADMYLFGALGTITARFTAPPKATYQSWNHYSVSASLETRTADYVTEATLDAALPAEPHTDNVTWPSDLFGNPSSDGYGEEAQSSSLRGKTSGYARPAMRRKSPVTVTQLPIKWEMSQAEKILFDAWYHYKLVDGAGWFWLYTDFHGAWQYIKVRFVESISLKYESVDWWEISGTIETVEYNYLPLADCDDLILPADAALPVITDQPDDWSGVVGSEVTLTVVATTETGTLTYQWYFGGEAISGATSASYVIESVATGNEGSYYVVVSNDIGHVQSNSVTIIVIEALWRLLSDTNVTVSSSVVSSWATTSSSYSFDQATSGIQPVIDTSDLLNGIAPIRFTNDYLISASTVGLPIGSNPFTISCLLRCISAAGTGGNTSYSYVWGYGGTANTTQPRALGCRGAGSTIWWSYSGGVSTVDSDDSEVCLITVSYDGTTGKLYRNGTLIGSAELAHTTTATQFSIGTWTSVLGERVADCSVWDMSAFSKALSSSEITEYLSYFNTRYGLSLT